MPTRPDPSRRPRPSGLGPAALLRARAGMSLIEVVISISLLGVVMVATTSIVVFASRAMPESASVSGHTIDPLPSQAPRVQHMVDMLSTATDIRTTNIIANNTIDATNRLTFTASPQLQGSLLCVPCSSGGSAAALGTLLGGPAPSQLIDACAAQQGRGSLLVLVQTTSTDRTAQLVATHVDSVRFLEDLQPTHPYSARHAFTTFAATTNQGGDDDDDDDDNQFTGLGDDDDDAGPTGTRNPANYLMRTSTWLSITPTISEPAQPPAPDANDPNTIAAPSTTADTGGNVAGTQLARSSTPISTDPATQTRPTPDSMPVVHPDALKVNPTTTEHTLLVQRLAPAAPPTSRDTNEGFDFDTITLALRGVAGVAPGVRLALLRSQPDPRTGAGDVLGTIDVAFPTTLDQSLDTTLELNINTLTSGNTPHDQVLAIPSKRDERTFTANWTILGIAGRSAPRTPDAQIDLSVRHHVSVGGAGDDDDSGYFLAIAPIGSDALSAWAKLPQVHQSLGLPAGVSVLVAQRAPAALPRGEAWTSTNLAWTNEPSVGVSPALRVRGDVTRQRALVQAPTSLLELSRDALASSQPRHTTRVGLRVTFLDSSSRAPFEAWTRLTQPLPRTGTIAPPSSESRSALEQRVEGMP